MNTSKTDHSTFKVERNGQTSRFVIDEHFSCSGRSQASTMNNNSISHCAVKNAVFKTIGNPSIDPFTSSVSFSCNCCRFSQFVFLLKKSINFGSFEQGSSVGTLQFHFAMATMNSFFISNNIGLSPLVHLVRKDVVFKLLPGKRPNARISVNVTKFSKSRIQASKHDIQVGEKKTFRIAEHGNCFGQIIEQRTFTAANFDCIKRLQFPSFIFFSFRVSLRFESHHKLNFSQSFFFAVDLTAILLIIIIVVVVVVVVVNGFLLNKH